MVFLQLLLMILSFGRPKLFRRLTRGWMKRTSGVKNDIWSVMKDFAKDPGGKDFSKMKSQYQMFVDTVVSKQVTE